MLSTFCLALVVYLEARGEPLDGQYLVAEVVVNRVQAVRWPDDVCDVSFEEDQFTGLNDQIDLQPIFMDPAWKTSMKVASDTLNGNTLGSGATHYHTTDIHPYWADKMVVLGQYGNHIFYRE